MRVLRDVWKDDLPRNYAVPMSGARPAGRPSIFLRCCGRSEDAGVLPKVMCMTDSELIEAYHDAKCDHDAAKAGTCNRVETFIGLLEAERVLASRMEINECLRRCGQIVRD
jgi:hypothetical protein